MFGFQRRGVRRCENDTLLPKPGLLPHTSQTEATGSLQFGRLLDRLLAGTRTPVVEEYPTNPVPRDSALGPRRDRQPADGAAAYPCGCEGNGGVANSGGRMWAAAWPSLLTRCGWSSATRRPSDWPRRLTCTPSGICWATTRAVTTSAAS